MKLDFLLPVVAYTNQEISIEIKPGLEFEAHRDLKNLSLKDWVNTYAKKPDTRNEIDINFWGQFGVDFFEPDCLFVQYQIGDQVEEFVAENFLFSE
jgi:hypothetical protein